MVDEESVRKAYAVVLGGSCHLPDAVVCMGRHSAGAA